MQAATLLSACNTVAKLLVRLNSWFPPQYLSNSYSNKLVKCYLYLYQHCFRTASLDEPFDFMGS